MDWPLGFGWLWVLMPYRPLRGSGHRFHRGDLAGGDMGLVAVTRISAQFGFAALVAAATVAVFFGGAVFGFGSGLFALLSPVGPGVGGVGFAAFVAAATGRVFAGGAVVLTRQIVRELDEIAPDD